MKLKKYILWHVLFALLVFSNALQAQDIHFSQFYNAPLQLNPALTGLMNGDVRFAANYRNQWQSVTLPFKTFAAAADMSLLGGISKHDFAGFGLLLMNDQAGDGNFNIAQVQLSAAYHKTLNGASNHYLGVGFQVGTVYHTIDPTKLIFDNQYNGDVFDQNLPSNEVIERSKFLFMDISAGLSWYYSPSRYNDFYLGFAIAHANQPNVSFYKNTSEPLTSKLTLHGGATIRLNGIVSLMPKVIYLQQDPHSELTLEALVKFYLDENNMFNGKTNLYVGASYRANDALIPTIRMDYGQISWGLSYDLNMSKLAKASQLRGGTELSLAYLIDYSGVERRKSEKVKCPAF